MKKILLFILLLSPLLLWTASPVEAADEQINWQVLPGAASYGTSNAFRVSGTIGQTAVGRIYSDSNVVNQGFRLSAVETYLCGDADHSGFVELTDAAYLINYVFTNGPEPVPYLSGDVDCNDIVDISDVIYMVDYIFHAGPEPCADCP